MPEIDYTWKWKSPEKVRKFVNERVVDSMIKILMVFNRQGTEDQQQSSTTSEQLASRKRKRSPSPVSDDDVSENFALLEEDWDLTKIIFIKDVKTVPIGKVTKVSDGVFGGGRKDYSFNKAHHTENRRPAW